MSAIPEMLPGEIVRDAPDPDAAGGLPRSAQIYLGALAVVWLAAAGTLLGLALLRPIHERSARPLQPAEAT